MTSPDNTPLIEKYIYRMLSPVDKLIFEAKLIISPELRRDLYYQKKTYKLIKMYHRQKLKEEMEILHQSIFNDPEKLNFRQSIYQIFK